MSSLLFVIFLLCLFILYSFLYFLIEYNIALSIT
ncbi:hypothetical protein [Enterococcus faecium]